MPEKREFYRIHVFGINSRYVQNIDVKEITGRLYGKEPAAWEDARALAKAARSQGRSASVFVTTCEAKIDSIKEKYDVPVMPEKK